MVKRVVMRSLKSRWDRQYKVKRVVMRSLKSRRDRQYNGYKG
jgi:hypothetical protein